MWQLEPDSYLDEVEFEHLLILQIRDLAGYGSWINKLMDLKVDNKKWYQNAELKKLRNKIKQRIKIEPRINDSYSRLQHPGINRIRKKILELQELGGKKEQPKIYYKIACFETPLYSQNVSIEGKEKLDNHWKIIRATSKKFKLSHLAALSQSAKENNESMNIEKTRIDYNTKSKDYDELKLITPEYLRKIKDDKKKYEEKRIKDKIFEKEDKKLTRDFNIKLKKIITSIPPNDPRPPDDMIDQLSKLIPALNNWKETDVTSRWGYFCHVTELFYCNFPNRLEHDFKTMEVMLLELEKISDPSTYTKTSY